MFIVRSCGDGKGQIPLDFLANHNVREQINRTLHDVDALTDVRFRGAAGGSNAMQYVK
jgi:hypothetical protein